MVDQQVFNDNCKERKVTIGTNFMVWTLIFVVFYEVYIILNFQLYIILINSSLTYSEIGDPYRIFFFCLNPLYQDLFIGGTDTTTTTMEWAITELLRNPDIMAKAKQELGETIGFGQSIEEKDIPRLPYLQALLKETMRLHPTAPLLLPHRADMYVEVCGYTIPSTPKCL